MDFQFIRQGTRYSVHTKVGDGTAQVEVKTAEQPARRFVMDEAISSIAQREHAEAHALEAAPC